MSLLNKNTFGIIIKSLPVERHVVVVHGVKRWQKLLKVKYLKEIENGYIISRKKLLNNKYKNNEEKCLDILMWGYPRGGRGNNIKKAVSRIVDIAKVVSNKKVTWDDYLKGFRGTGVGVATASKFAFFYKLTFEGHKALILDQQIADILETGVWGKALSSVGVYREWSKNYIKYLKEMESLADKIKCSEAQLELSLYLFGKAFR
jgi:hypothetical protein